MKRWNRLQLPFLTVIIVVLLSLSGCGKKEASKTSTAPKPSPPEQAATDAEHVPVAGRMFEFTGVTADSQPFDSREMEGLTWIGMLVDDTSALESHAALLDDLSRVIGQHPSEHEIKLVALLSSGADHETAAARLGDRWLPIAVDPATVTRWRDEFYADEKADASEQPLLVLVDGAGRVRNNVYPLAGTGVDERINDFNLLLAERIGMPLEIFNPPWLENRRLAQIESAKDFSMFHDFQFEDKFFESGIRFRNKVVDDAGRAYQAGHYDHGNGVAIADVDRDGLLDVYFVSQVGGNELWRNLGDGRFENITDRAGVGLKDRIGVSASFADIDNDGDADLYVTTVRDGNVLFENDGTGIFRDISAESGTGYVGHSSSAVFFDYNRDGLLDLFVTNVGQYTTDDELPVTMEELRGEPQVNVTYHDSVTDAFGGHLKPERAERSLLFQNTGNNTFRDVTEETGLIDESWSGAATPLDINEDGWPDLYLTNMQGNDEYYENQEGKSFVRKSREVFPKTPWGAMGVKSFDYDNDGDFDVFITDMHSDMSQDVGPALEKNKSDMMYPESFLQTAGQSIFGNAFYQNEGDGTFLEVSDEVGAENYWPWGLSVGDLNADGFEDVFIASSMNLSFRYGINSLLLNDRGDRFVDAEFVLGVEPRRGGVTAIPWHVLDCGGADKDHIDCQGRSGESIVWSALGSRSSVIFDMDDDGDLDIITNDFNSRPLVLISNLAEQKPELNYLKIELEGTASNRQGLGAVVRVTAGESTWTQRHDGQSGYLSQSAAPLYFGLADVGEVDAIEVKWPSGLTQKLAGPIEGNQLLRIIEEEEADQE